MENVYTLICYRPNGADVCSNVVMNTSDSDIILERSTDTSRIISIISECLADNLKNKYLQKREICNWKINLFCDRYFDDEEDHDQCYEMKSIILEDANTKAEKQFEEFKAQKEKKSEEQDRDRKKMRKLELLRELKELGEEEE